MLGNMRQGNENKKLPKPANFFLLLICEKIAHKPPDDFPDLARSSVPNVRCTTLHPSFLIGFKKSSKL